MVSLMLTKQKDMIKYQPSVHALSMFSLSAYLIAICFLFSEENLDDSGF